jgi:hypothetical protein
VLRVEAKSTTALASTRGEANDFARRIGLLEDELVEVHQAREAAKENSWGLSNIAADTK